MFNVKGSLNFSSMQWWKGLKLLKDQCSRVCKRIKTVWGNKHIKTGRKKKWSEGENKWYDVIMMYPIVGSLQMPYIIHRLPIYEIILSLYQK